MGHPASEWLGGKDGVCKDPPGPFSETHVVWHVAFQGEIHTDYWKAMATLKSHQRLQANYL